MRVAVAGAGDTGQSVARALLHAGHQVLLIERYRTAYRPIRVPDAEWMFADACEFATLQKAGIETCDAVIAASGDDKANLVFAYLCKTEFAVSRVVARINNPSHRDLFTAGWGVDVAVGSPEILIAAAEQQVSPHRAVRLLTLHRDTSLLEFTVAAGSRADGRTIGELPVPPDAAFLALVHDRLLFPPKPGAALQAGDEVLVLASPDAEPRVRKLLEPAPDLCAEPELGPNGSPHPPGRVQGSSDSFDFDVGTGEIVLSEVAAELTSTATPHDGEPAR